MADSSGLPTDVEQLFAEAGAITGQIFNVTDIMKQKILEAGFVNVVEQVYKTPLGGWPADAKLRELGQWALLGFDTGLEGYALATLTRVLGVSDTELHTLLGRNTDDSSGHPLKFMFSCQYRHRSSWPKQKHS